jgi:hypothetical protein
VDPVTTHFGSSWAANGWLMSGTLPQARARSLLPILSRYFAVSSSGVLTQQLSCTRLALPEGHEPEQLGTRTFCPGGKRFRGAAGVCSCPVLTLAVVGIAQRQ